MFILWKAVHCVLKPLTMIVDVSISPSCVLKLCCYVYKESKYYHGFKSFLAVNEGRE